MSQVIESYFFIRDGIAYQFQRLESGGECESLVGDQFVEKNEGTEEEQIMVQKEFDVDDGTYKKMAVEGSA